MCMISLYSKYLAYVRNVFPYLGNDAFNISDGAQKEEKRGQFLGVTLKSKDDTFLVTCISS